MQKSTCSAIWKILYLNVYIITAKEWQLTSQYQLEAIQRSINQSIFILKTLLTERSRVTETLKMVGDMSRVTMNYDLSKIPLVCF